LRGREGTALAIERTARGKLIADTFCSVLPSRRSSRSFDTTAKFSVTNQTSFRIT
jgi:hypothetical protein